MFANAFKEEEIFVREPGCVVINHQMKNETMETLRQTIQPRQVFVDMEDRVECQARDTVPCDMVA
jgi:hypothetical protein